MIPFVGPSYQLNTRKADVQRTVNMFVVIKEMPSGKTQTYLKAVPGLVVFSSPLSLPQQSIVEDSINQLQWPEDEDFGFFASP